MREEDFFCEAELKVKQTTEEAKLALVASRLIITGPGELNSGTAH